MIERSGASVYVTYNQSRELKNGSGLLVRHVSHVKRPPYHDREKIRSQETAET